jgi:hypothetical protein
VKGEGPVASAAVDSIKANYAGNITDDARSLLFDISSTVTRIELKNGSIVSVESEDI